MLTVLGVLIIAGFVLLFIAGALEIGGWPGWLIAFGIVAAMLYGAMSADAAMVPINGPRWAQRAVDEMRVPVPADQGVVLGACPGYAGEAAACNFPAPASPIYIDPSMLMGQTAAMRPVLYRELGGRFDTLAMTPAARWHFMAVMRYRGAWENSATAVGLVERFEDAYSDCSQGLKPARSRFADQPGAWEDSSGYDPSRRQHVRVCALIDRVGAHAGFVTPSPRPPHGGDSGRAAR